MTRALMLIYTETQRKGVIEVISTDDTTFL